MTCRDRHGCSDRTLEKGFVRKDRHNMMECTYANNYISCQGTCLPMAVVRQERAAEALLYSHSTLSGLNGSLHRSHMTNQSSLSGAYGKCTAFSLAPKVKLLCFAV